MPSSEPKGKYGVVYLSPRRLWPSDGLNLQQSACGELFGYGYFLLPLTRPKSVTAGKPVPTGNQCWCTRSDRTQKVHFETLWRRGLKTAHRRAAESTRPPALFTGSWPRMDVVANPFLGHAQTEKTRPRPDCFCHTDRERACYVRLSVWNKNSYDG